MYVGGYYTTTPETEMCWSDSPYTIQKREQGLDPLTNPCSNKASTYIGLCADCYEATIGRAATQAAPLIPVVFEPLEPDDLPY